MTMQHRIEGNEATLLQSAMREITILREQMQKLNARTMRLNAAVVVINIPWLNWGPLRAQQAQAFNAIIAEEASKRSIYVVDAWSLFGECGMDCIGKDGFHPSQAGYDLLRRAIPPLPPLRCRPIGWVERNQ
jgi:lysophospholipase L1-like esterase